jgi:starch synthase (maltosyl-transferring)
VPELPREGRQRVVIEGISLEIDGGRFPAKRALDEPIEVQVDMFTDGHDAIGGVLLHRHAADDEFHETRLEPLVNDRWRATFQAERLGRHLFTVEGWVDHFESWRRGLGKKHRAGQDVTVELLAGAELVAEAAARASRKSDADRLTEAAGQLRAERTPYPQRVALALDPELDLLIQRYPDRSLATRYERELEVDVDPPIAGFSAWYEFFPRSCVNGESTHGRLSDCTERLGYVASMGFDIVYLPPIHPIGRVARKGPNNTLDAGPDDPGSPWAIGAAEGGHKSLHPDLGTMDDFDAFVARARELGLQVALDIAYQCAPDHPYVKEHPSWFKWRPDGTVQYAENPPKKYQDIYPFDFESEDWRELWQELLDVVLFWVDRGITVFRVDNPHTKPFPFWEWMIGEVRSRHPEVIFLAEAFTRPKVMGRLAKLGYSQSYTYFTWRNTKTELQGYLDDLTRTGLVEYFRPNFWPNTPDILPEYLQTGGRPGFIARLVLAATLSSNYGIYGPAFELLEATPRELFSEEYLDSEKYQVRRWNLSDPRSLRELITRVNAIRREHPAFRTNRTLRFVPTDNEMLLAYTKQSLDGSEIVLVVVNLDPHHRHSGWLDLPTGDLGILLDAPFQVHDLLSGARYLWHGAQNYIEITPEAIPAHIFRIRRKVRTERDFDYFM